MGCFQKSNWHHVARSVDFRSFRSSVILLANNGHLRFAIGKRSQIGVSFSLAHFGLAHRASRKSGSGSPMSGENYRSLNGIINGRRSLFPRRVLWKRRGSEGSDCKVWMDICRKVTRESDDKSGKATTEHRALIDSLLKTGQWEFRSHDKYVWLDSKIRKGVRVSVPR